MAAPAQPKLYHITHVDNLTAILRDGGLQCDAEMIRRGGPPAAIGMSSIKARRLSLPVKCWPGDSVGDYVPFYFCPRSIMLYLIHCANHPELAYRGGQGPIVHLELDLYETIEWAEKSGQRWAFSLSNAGAVYTEFRRRLEDLDEINWNAVSATDFRLPEIKEGKQAEFLVRSFAPWDLVRRVGVISAAIQRRASLLLASAKHQPPVQPLPQWYYG